MSVRNSRTLSFQTKLILSVCAVVFFSGAAVSWLAFRSAQATTTVLADSLIREASNNAATHAQDYVIRARPIVESLQRLAEYGLALDDTELLAQQMLAFSKSNPGITWISYSDEMGTFTGVQNVSSTEYLINQSHLEDDKTTTVERKALPDGSLQLLRRQEDGSYDPRTRPFYLAAKRRGRLTWLEPYIFFEGVPGITCACPVFAKSGELRGVLSVDFNFEVLSKFVEQIRISPNSQIFLFTSDQTLLTNPLPELGKSQGTKDEKRLVRLSEIGDARFKTYAQSLKLPQSLSVGQRDFQLRR